MKRLGEVSLGAAGLVSALLLALISIDVILDGRISASVINETTPETTSE